MEQLNKSEWKAIGFVPIDGQKPSEIITRYYPHRHEHHIYTRDQVRKVRPVNVRPATDYQVTPENVANATMLINRSAKRYRDAARSCYEVGAYSFATANKEKKERLYHLKDKGVRWLIENGHLECTAKHGSMYFYTGLDRSFHSSIAPAVEPSVCVDEEMFVEAKPRDTKQKMRLKDAIHLIINFS